MVECMELIPSLYTKFQTAAYTHACSLSVMVYEHGLDHRAIYNMLLVALHYISIRFHAACYYAQEYFNRSQKQYWELVAST